MAPDAVDATALAVAFYIVNKCSFSGLTESSFLQQAGVRLQTLVCEELTNSPTTDDSLKIGKSLTCRTVN